MTVDTDCFRLTSVEVSWRGLVVAPECRCTPYDRYDYDYPQSVEVQIAERLGGMVSPYDGTRFESLKDFDIEHIVAVSEAHDFRDCAPPARRCVPASPATWTT